jgi:hypothetical protein
MPHNERRSVTEARARYAKQLQLAAPDAMRPKRYLDNVTEMAIENKRALAAGLRHRGRWLARGDAP